MVRPLLSVLLALPLAACAHTGASRSDGAPPPSARGGYTFDLRDQVIKPATPMVAQPLPQKLYVIIDPAQVEDAFLIDNSIHGVEGFRAFFQGSLKAALRPFFSDIVFVDPGFQLPPAPQFVAQARADRIYSRDVTQGFVQVAQLEMNWAFAIRPSTQKDFAFSFSGVAKSELSYYTLWIGAQQLMTSAMHELLQAWTDKNVYQALARPTEGAPREDPKKEERRVVAVFDVQDASKKLSPDTLEQLSTYLSTLLVQDGKFSVVPRDQVRARLQEKKKDSYQQCMDESCQIELGKAVAAEMILSTQLIRAGKKCVLTSNLFDLKTETAREGATVETGCETEALLGTLKQIAKQLSSSF